ncbi:MAG: aminotransferase class I/II-fold pyridoxal phosphate-dependent enzyme [Natronomonas sp.]
MQIDRFDLEEWFHEVEYDAEVMLAESGVRPLSAERFDTDPGTLGYVIPTNGDPEFRETIGARHDRAAEEVVFTCGTQEANLLAFLALMGEHAVVVTPTYGALTGLPAALGETTTVPLDRPGWRLDPTQVAEALRPETAVVIINNPNNPTGRAHDEETLRAIYEICADNGTHLLCDEVYRGFADDPVAPIASFGRYGVSTGGVSKAFGLSGVRFGWLCGPPAVVAAAREWHHYTTLAPPVFGQHVARQAIDDADAILAESREIAAEGRRRVAQFVDDRELVWSDPDCGVNAFVEVPPGFAGGESFCRRLLRETSVVLAPGEAFGYPDRFRIGFGYPAALEEGLSRVEAFLDRH